MTLGGLALVIGTLLDNNIVVLENVFRHLSMGKPVSQAAGDGTNEVALPMLVVTISILIVYGPIDAVHCATNRLLVLCQRRRRPSDDGLLPGIDDCGSCHDQCSHQGRRPS